MLWFIPIFSHGKDVSELDLFCILGDVNAGGLEAPHYPASILEVHVSVDKGLD